MSHRKSFERLPSDVRPHLYDLYLQPNLNTFEFDGRVVVFLEILQPTNKILLNSVDLKIKTVLLKLQSTGKSLIPISSLSVEDETLSLQFTEDLPVDNAELIVEFTGKLNDKMKGFYRSKYVKSSDEESKYFAVTQFAATDARRCFPCWDEPAIKSRFDVTLTVQPNKVALSNMPVATETQNEKDKLKIVKFLRTPIMSTYLVAFVVGDFDYVEGTTSDGILVRVYTPPGKKEQGNFALLVATKVLSFYKEYFQIAYPLPKIDLIAVSEMSAGAMENWGLVTFRETYLLVDEANTSAATRQKVAVIISHELAHQWFGNLVTMEWWTHLWLNEGYATFVEFLCVAHLFPEYDIWTQFVTSLYCAFVLDSLKNSHPIEIPVGHPAEVEEIFDEISYNKGASIIRMLYKYIGDDDFRKGMNLYLTRHQYNNAFTEDLWAALEEESLKPITTVMPTWTKQVGFPIITVESSVQENNCRTLILSQRKFCIDASQCDDEMLWMVPLSFCKQSKPSEICYTTLLSTQQSKITIPEIASDEWIKLNPDTVGYFRIEYPAEMLQQFAPAIQNKILPPLDRLGLVDDLFALVQAGKATTIRVLDLIQVMKEEDNYTVWSNIAGYLGKIRNLLYNTDFYHLFNTYGLRIMKPIYEKLGYENKPGEDHLTTLLRTLVLNQLVEFGDRDFAEIALKKFHEHCRGTETIPADLRTAVYKAVISVAGRSGFIDLLNLFKATTMQEEKERILRSFSAVTDITLVDDILNFSQSEEVNPPSAVITIISVASSKVGRDKTWQFVKENYDSIYQKYTGAFLLWRLVKSTTENYASKERAQEIDSFFAAKNIRGIERTIQQALETVRNNAAWLQRDENSIRSYLNSL